METFKYRLLPAIEMWRSQITLKVGVLRPEFVHVTMLRSLRYPVDFEVGPSFRDAQAQNKLASWGESTAPSS